MDTRPVAPSRVLGSVVVLSVLTAAMTLGSDAAAVAKPAVPPLAVFQADTAARLPLSVGVPDVEAGRCPEQRYARPVPRGSVFVIVRPRPGKRCAVWLGGETENPAYSGLPSTYCELLPKSRRFVIAIGQGGPAVSAHQDCAPTGFPQVK